MPHISISLEADVTYKNQLALLAKARGITLGQLVRTALDAQLGSDMERATIFFTQSDSQMNHSVPQTKEEQEG